MFGGGRIRSSSDSPLERTGFEPSVPLQGCAGKEAVAATGVVIIRRGQYRLKPWSGDDPAGASEISRFGLGCPLRLAGVFDLQLTPHPGSVIGIVALSGGTPEFRVLQQLEPADDLCATLFCLHRLAWRLAIEEGKRVIEGTPVVIIQVGVDGLFGHLGR